MLYKIGEVFNENNTSDNRQIGYRFIPNVCYPLSGYNKPIGIAAKRGGITTGKRGISSLDGRGRAPQQCLCINPGMQTTQALSIGHFGFYWFNIACFGISFGRGTYR